MRLEVIIMYGQNLQAMEILILGLREILERLEGLDTPLDSVGSHPGELGNRFHAPPLSLHFSS